MKRASSNLRKPGIARTLHKLTAHQRQQWRLQEAKRRLALLGEFNALVQQGLRPGQAAARMGQERVTLWRYQKKFQSGGFEALIPETSNCGRASVAAKLQLTEEEVKAVQRLNLDQGSNTAAWRSYAQSGTCRPEVAAVILDPAKRSHSIPPSLFDATKVSVLLDISIPDATRLQVVQIGAALRLQVAKAN